MVQLNKLLPTTVAQKVATELKTQGVEVLAHRRYSSDCSILSIRPDDVRRALQCLRQHYNARCW